MKLILASYSIPHEDKKVCLYDTEKHALVLNRKGQVRVFAHRASARGTRSRILNGKQVLYTC